MTPTEKTLYELAPDQFVMPGRSENGTKPLADLVFVRDKDAPGVVYYAELDASDLDIEDSEIEIRDEK